MQNESRLARLLRRGRRVPDVAGCGTPAGAAAKTADSHVVAREGDDGSETPAPVQRAQTFSSGQVAASRIRASIRDQQAMTQTPSPYAAEPAEASSLVPDNMSVLSRGLTMKGAEISAPDEDLTVHGTYEGVLRVRSLVVSAGATVIGEIQAETVKVWGAIRGNVRGANVFIYKGASVGGSVKCDVFGIQPGASVKAQLECDASELIVEDVGGKDIQHPRQQATTSGFEGGEFGPLRVVKG